MVYLILYLYFFSYTMPTFWKGRKKTLDERDLYKALNEHKSGKLTHSRIFGIFNRINEINEPFGEIEYNHK